MSLTREVCTEDPQYPGSQYLPTWHDTQVSPSCMIEDPASFHRIYSISEATIKSTVESTHQTGQSNQVIHFKSIQDPNQVNLYAEILDSPSAEEKDVPSNSWLIPQYSNLCTSGLRQIKWAQEIYTKVICKPKLLILIYLFASVSMSSTKSTIPETASFQPQYSNTNKNTSIHQKISPTSPTL